MRALIQRVRHASVTVEGKVTGAIEQGFLVLLGVTETDTEAEVTLLTDKLLKLRLFSDADGKTNCSIQDVNGALLVISQFTLCADCRKGNRPSFSTSAAPETGKALYAYFAECLRQNGVKRVETGVFAADMQVDIQNDGPVTIWLDSEIFKQSRRS